MSRRGSAIGVALLLVTAAVLRLHRLGEGLWLDEVLTFVNYARLPFAGIATTYNDQNQHLLYSLAAHASFLAFGESAWALRLPAALFGVASIWATYLFGRQITSRTEAWLAAALLTVSFHHVWFSQNARAYTALLFFTLVSSAVLLQAMRTGRPWRWGLYAILVALGMYSHLTMMFVAAGQFGAFAWESARAVRDPRRLMLPLGGFAASAVLTLVLYAPVLPQLLGPGLAEETEVAVWLNPLWTLTETLARLQIGLVSGAVFGVVALAGLAVLLAGTGSYARQQPALLALFIGPVIAGAGVTIALQHALWPRFFFFAAGFAMLIVVRGLAATAGAAARWASLREPLGRAAGTALATLAVLASAVALPRAYGPKQDYEGAREFVVGAAGTDDAIATSGLAAHVYRGHYAPEWSVVGTPAQLRALARGGAVWVVVTMPMHLEAQYPELAAELREHFEPVKQFPGTLGDGMVYVYRSKDAWPSGRHASGEVQRP